MHANHELSPLKHKLVVVTFFEEQIIRTFVFKGCEVLIKKVVLKANLIPLEMWDFDVILGMDWLSTHRALVEYFTKKVIFWKPRFLELEFKRD